MSGDAAGTDALTSEYSTPDSEEAPKKPSAQIMRQELKEAQDAFGRAPTQLFFSALSAGMEIGFSLFLMGVMQTLVDRQLPPAVMALLVANMYSFGFVLVILGRSELFTEQTSLAVLPVLNREESVFNLMRLWGIVYAGNLLGAAAFAAMVAYAGPLLEVIESRILISIAEKTVRHQGHVIFVSGILAGWLMGLLSWLVAAGRDTISQIVIVWLITTAIGLGHLHHSILGAVEVLAGVFSPDGLTLGEFVHFLIWATLGNAVGGPLFLAILKFTHSRPLN